MQATLRPKEEVSRLRKALGDPSPPVAFTQEPFDFDPSHLVRLSRLSPDQEAAYEDLWAYTQDLCYDTIDPLLLRHALSFCLRGWERYVTGRGNEYGGFVEYFYPALIKANALLTARESAAVSAFMRAAILAEIDAQRCLESHGAGSGAHRWFCAFASHGVLFPDISDLWQPLSRADTVGRAVAWVQYASCLMYKDDENPVFSRWTPDGGGGPPELWCYEGHLYTQTWLPSNLDFLRSALKPASVRDALDRALSTLAGHPQHSRALQVRRDCDAHWPIVVKRCAELPTHLSCDQSVTHPEWSV